MKSFRLFTLAIASVGLTAVAALADSVSPASYEASVAIGGSVTITKTVTVDAGTPTTSKVDVFFLTDATGSMFSLINNVKTGASSILSSAAALGDVAFGVGEYRDNGDAFVYRLDQDITTSQAAAQAGINSWVADGGGDFPEANLYGLERMANGSSWRPGSSRIALWFGDAPGHDPSGPTGVTLAGSIAALQANGIKVLAMDLSSLNSTGQAAAITAATGGTLYSGINPATIVSQIDAAITTAFESYSTVSLNPVGNLPGVQVDITPASHSGAYDRSVARDFMFDVTYTGLVAGDHSFTVQALVDGGVVATESDLIHVAAVPEPATLVLLASGLVGLAAKRRRLHA